MEICVQRFIGSTLGNDTRKRAGVRRVVGELAGREAEFQIIELIHNVIL